MKKISYLPNRPDQFISIKHPKSEWVKNAQEICLSFNGGGIYADRLNG